MIKMIKCADKQVKINHIDIPMGDIEKNESTYADSSIGEGMDITIQVAHADADDRRGNGQLDIIIRVPIHSTPRSGAVNNFFSPKKKLLFTGRSPACGIFLVAASSSLAQNAQIAQISQIAQNFQIVYCSGCKWPFEKG